MKTVYLVVMYDYCDVGFGNIYSNLEAAQQEADAYNTAHFNALARAGIRRDPDGPGPWEVEEYEVHDKLVRPNEQ